MSDFTGQTPAATYKNILQVANLNIGIDSTLRPVSSGAGTDSPLYLSTTEAAVNGNFGVGISTGMLSKFHVVSSGFGNAPAIADSFLLDNQTPVTGAGAVQYAPPIIQRGRARKTNATAAEQTVDFRGLLTTTDGATAVTGTYRWGFSINGGAFNTAITLDSSGAMSVLSGFACNGGFYNASSPVAANIWANSASTATQTNGTGLYFGTSGNISLRTAFNGTTNYAVPAGNILGNVIIGAMAATEASSGTHPLLANLIVRAPAFTNAAGASTELTTVYIEGAPTGSATSTNGNLALLIGSGNVRAGGMLSVFAGSAQFAGLLQLGAGLPSTAVIGFSGSSVNTTTPIRHTLDYDTKVWSLSANDSVRRTIATWIVDRTPVPVAAVPVPTTYYGSAGTRMMGEPDGWFETLKADGTAVGVPFYNLG